MVILVQNIVECKLEICSEINGNRDCTTINGRGYCKIENNTVVVYFSSGDFKYKYTYVNDCLIVNCNDSEYIFEVGKNNVGKIKNGEYTFEITTFATKIKVNNSSIILDYKLSQQGTLIGNYTTELSFN